MPADAELTARPDEIPAWDDMPDDLKPVLARQMEVYAGFLEHTDHHIGRLVDALEELEVLDDTLVYVIVGDNGASAEGTPNGTLQRAPARSTGQRRWRPPSSWPPGSTSSARPAAYNHYAVGWAHAMDTPYQWTKQVASHWGGTRNGTIVHWPRGIEAKGEIRHQFHHVIDVAPTVLEAAGLPEPTFVHGVQQRPYEGVSMAYSFDDAGDAEDRHTTQYFEMFVNRGIYHRGWTAVTRHSHPLGRDQAVAGATTTTCGSSTRPTTGPRRRNLADAGPGAARAPAAPLPPRGGQVQRVPARRPPGGAVQRRPGRASLPDPRQQPGALRRHGPADRERPCSTSRTSRTR